jgi:hypothetical protein
MCVCTSIRLHLPAIDSLKRPNLLFRFGNHGVSGPNVNVGAGAMAAHAPVSHEPRTPSLHPYLQHHGPTLLLSRVAAR